MKRLVLLFALVMALSGIEAARFHVRDAGYWSDPPYRPETVGPVRDGTGAPLPIVEVVLIEADAVARPRDRLRCSGVICAGALGLLPVVVAQLVSPGSSSLLQVVTWALRSWRLL